MAVDGAVWLFTWTQYLWLCFAAVQCQIRLHKKKLTKAQRLIKCFFSSSQNIRAVLWLRLRRVFRSIRLDVCFEDSHRDVIFVSLLVRWSYRRNRSFSCKDKEQLYCSVTDLWLCPCHAKCWQNLTVTKILLQKTEKYVKMSGFTYGKTFKRYRYNYIYS